MSNPKEYSEEQIAFVLETRHQDTNAPWNDIVKKFNEKFKTAKNADAIRRLFFRYADQYKQPDLVFKNLKDIERRKKSNSYTIQENKILVKNAVLVEDILENIKDIIENSKPLSKDIKKLIGKKDNKKENMTMELMVSDVHVGKLIDLSSGNKKVYVDHEEIVRRVKKMTRVVIDEIKRESKSFNVEKLILNFIGDLIESSHFHGGESEKSCEFGSSRQVAEAIKLFYVDVVYPLALTGIKIEFIASTGNHDRLEKEKTYNNPGEANLTYIIYSSIELLAKRDKLTNVTFNIAKGLYVYTKIYGCTLFAEHGDELKNINRDTVNNWMSRRQNQVNQIIHFYRTGHWHEYFMYGQGKFIGNGSVPGQDSYADSKAFNSEAIQVLNYYVETQNRPTCFFRSFPIYLDRK